ncbi:DUF21-domain-containing protein [Dacryopinax primogenitus]|uniref:DUF21-domain-containing protein n=1 Tax=Dacryopinax primogenitus (strain DJM 731) TaxID=1858805 RepID=M5GD52_DACPD|nr:DUF21-domain-containing protein [Dacryopinax primogenitus]EJU04262.1 DUF21-domain-containing protein [Dacryopinax primogenitus]
MIPVLVILSGIFAGLTLGYMSLDETQLHVLSVSGSPKQKKYARQIMPIRKNGHLLLTTLLIANMIVNETLPVVSDNVLGGGVEAVVISTVLIVIFSEIIPQSVCSRYGLAIGAKMALPTRCLIYLLFIVSWPVAKVLELILGPHQGIIYRRQELKELINMHLAGEGGKGDLAGDTVNMVGGALDFQVKKVEDAMTPLSKVFHLEADAKLDYETLAMVVKSGHSRIPIFETNKEEGQERIKCLGILLVKQCVLLDPEDATPVRSIPLNKIPIVSFDEPLLGILDRFQEGRSHIALVSRIPRQQEPQLQKVNGDVKEHKQAKESLTRRFLNKIHLGDSDSEEDESTAAGDMEKGGSTSGKKDAAGSRFSNNLEQVMPADAVLDKDGAERFLQTLEGNPLGIITLEDVLEELIGEEILDEFDLTGAQALPASSFVPEEAKRAVDAARSSGRAKRVAQGLRIVKRAQSTPTSATQLGEQDQPLAGGEGEAETLATPRPAGVDAPEAANSDTIAPLTEEPEVLAGSTHASLPTEPADGGQRPRKSVFKSSNNEPWGGRRRATGTGTGTGEPESVSVGNLHTDRHGRGPDNPREGEDFAGPSPAAGI